MSKVNASYSPTTGKRLSEKFVKANPSVRTESFTFDVDDAQKAGVAADADGAPSTLGGARDADRLARGCAPAKKAAKKTTRLVKRDVEGQFVDKDARGKGVRTDFIPLAKKAVKKAPAKKTVAKKAAAPAPAPVVAKKAVKKAVVKKVSVKKATKKAAKKSAK